MTTEKKQIGIKICPWTISRKGISCNSIYNEIIREVLVPVFQFEIDVKFKINNVLNGILHDNRTNTD